MAREALLNPKQAQAQRQTTFKDTLPCYTRCVQWLLHPAPLTAQLRCVRSPDSHSWAEARRNSLSQCVPVTPDDRLQVVKGLAGERCFDFFAHSKDFPIQLLQ